LGEPVSVAAGVVGLKGGGKRTVVRSGLFGTRGGKKGYMQREVMEPL